ncbi:MAG TPA: transketolase [Opitutales bacterium]|nr:transketolase [Opitutales bacterium]
MTPAELAGLDQVARRLRYDVVQMSHRAGTPHLASALSCVDALTVLYWRVAQINADQPADPARDRCILSKGHAASALYAVLATRGFFPRSELETFAKHGAALAEQPAPGCAPGVELATGSLGHGLPVGTGLALAARIQKQPYRVFVVMSDGECNEGTVWEAAMLAAAHKLGRLTIVIDYNKWQATGRSNEVMALDPLVDKWRAFGWDAQELDGHDLAALDRALTAPAGERPRAIVAHTVKGKGVSFMEDDNNWHYRVPTAEEVEKARLELGIA